jgi:hypothetical protein
MIMARYHANLQRAVMLIILGSIGIAVAILCRADEKAEAQTVIDKAIQAMGGQANLAKLKAVTWKSHGTFQFKSAPNPFTSHWAMQGPNHYRKIRDETENGRSNKTILVLDGNRGWFRNHKNALITFPTNGLAGLRQENFLHWIALRLDLTDRAITLSARGQSRVDGRAVQGIKITHRDLHDVQFELLFDAETGLLTKLITRSSYRDTPPEERTFSEYRETRGVKYAAKLRWTARYGDDLAIQEEERYDMQFHEKLDDSVFDQP